MVEDPQGSLFQSEVEYAGVGSARFVSPSGSIKGPAVARFDERGRKTIRIQVQDLGADEPTMSGLTEFLSGRKIIREGAVVGHSLSFEVNSCAELLVKTTAGTFRASGDIHYSYTAALFGTKGELRFSPLRSQFEFAGVGPPKYWLLPLSNFISERWEHTTALDDHPLRIQPSKTAETGAVVTDRAIAATLHSSRLIVFAFNGRPGFIEPLRDYADRGERLTSGREQSVVTALMIGEIAGEVGEFAEVQKWFPADLLSVLGLATGVEIGAPWLEIRDQSGSIVRRFHMSFGQPSFSLGHAAVREGIHTGIGHLLTRSLASPDRHSSALRTAVDNVIRAGLHHSGTVEEKLIYLFRALDGLCNELKLYEATTLSAALNPEQAAVVLNALNTAVTTVSKLESDAAKLHQNDQADFLRRIAEQVSGAKVVSSGFTTALLCLLDKLHLHDAEVMRGYYGNDTGWTKLLRRYRAIPIHRNYFDFQARDEDIREVSRVIFHLHDIITRIVLKRLNYGGTYQPTTVKWLVDAQLDWVQPDTPPSMLGYPGFASQRPGIQDEDEGPTEGAEGAQALRQRKRSVTGRATLC